MYSKLAIFKLFRVAVAVGITLILKLASFTELGNNKNRNYNKKSGINDLIWTKFLI